MSATHSTGKTYVPVTYRVGAGGTGGIWLGLGIGQVAAIGSGLLAGILALTAGASPMLAVLPLLAGAGLAAARAGGRPLLNWGGPLSGHHAASIAGSRRWSAPVPTFARNAEMPRLRLPAEFGRLRLLACPGDPSIGMLTEPSRRTVTVVFDVCGVDRFPLLDDDERDGLITAWGDSLAVLADTDRALERLQLIERACPSPTVTTRPATAGDQTSQLDLLHWQITALSTRHDSRLAVQWVFPRLDASVLAAIAARCQTVSRSLLPARLLTRPLSVDELARDIATALRGPQAGSTATPGPVSRRREWTHVTTDDTVHRSYAVTEWPSAAVTATWLSPLLLCAPAEVTRTVSLHLQRVPPASAARVARTRRAKAALDQRDRTRLGLATSAALDLAEVDGAAMDSELASGYRTHRLAGLVTLSSTKPDSLDDAGRVLLAAAATSRLELRALHGQHDTALAATLPLCRALHRGQA
jgi:hypothetical protein